MKKSQETSLIMPVTPEFIERRVFFIRGQKVMIDNDLAELYQVPTGHLNRAVKRNTERFPSDFMFQLTRQENESLICQIGTSNAGSGGRRHFPHVFTELGVGMLSSVLNSDRAVQMNIFIMRAFVKLREMLATHKDLARKIGQLEKDQGEHTKHLVVISSALKDLMNKTDKLEDSFKPFKPVIGYQED